MNAPRLDPVLGVSDASFDAVFAMGETGVLLAINPAAERMFGYSRDEALGRPIDELVVPPELRDALHETLARVATGEEPNVLGGSFRTRGLDREGRRFPIEISVTRLPGEGSAFVCFVRPAAAVGEEVATAAELADVGWWSHDMRSGEVTWTDALFRQFGMAAAEGELPKEEILDRVHPDDRAGLADVMRALIDHPAELTGRDIEVGYRTRHPDGTFREIRACGRMETDDGGEPLRWVGSARDVTGEIQARRELDAHFGVDQALTGWTSFDEGAQAVLGALGEALDYPLAVCWTWHEEHERLTCRTLRIAPGVEAPGWAAAAETALVRPGLGVAGVAWAAGKPVFLHDLSVQLPRPGAQLARDLGLRTAVGVPAMCGSEPLAVLTFYAFDLRRADPSLMRTLTGIGDSVGRFLDRRRASLTAPKLSDRQLEVLRLAAEGLSGPEIAAQLVLQPATIKTHFEHIYRRLEVSDRAAAVAVALRTGLIG